MHHKTVLCKGSYSTASTRPDPLINAVVRLSWQYDVSSERKTNIKWIQVNETRQAEMLKSRDGCQFFLYPNEWKIWLGQPSIFFSLLLPKRLKIVIKYYINLLSMLSPIILEHKFTYFTSGKWQFDSSSSRNMEHSEELPSLKDTTTSPRLH